MWLIWLLVLCSSVWASPIWMSGFELPDTPSATGDDMQWVSTWSGSNKDSTIGQMGVADCTANGNPHRCCSARGVGNCQHDETIGGGIGSHRALQVDAATGQTSYVSLPQANKCTAASTCSLGANTSEGCDYCTGDNLGNGVAEIGAHTTLSLGFNVRFDSLPTSGTPRSIAMIMEGDPTRTPIDIGCQVKVRSDRKFELFYNTTQLGGGATSEVANNNACSNDKTKSCASASDCCLGGAGCSCGTCSTSAPTNCAWTAVGVSQVTGVGGATCKLYIRGRLSLTGSKTDSTATAVGDVRIGAPGGESSNTLQATFDDVVIDDSDDPGWGYIAHAAPGIHGTCTSTGEQCQISGDCPNKDCNNNADGSGPATAWTRSTSGQSYSSPIRDSASAVKPFRDSTTADLTVKLPNLSQQFWRLQISDGSCSINNDCVFQGGGTCTNGYCVSPTTNMGVMSIPESQAQITAVGILLTGNTNNVSAVREIAIAPLTRVSATASTLASTEIVRRVLGGAITNFDHAWFFGMYLKNPGGQSWTKTDIQNLGMQFRSTVNYNSTSDRTSVAAALVYVRADMRTIPPKNIQDRNRGVKVCSTHTDCAPDHTTACSSATDATSRTCGWCEGGKCIRDGHLVIASIGDSTNGGTFSSKCQGGSLPDASCSQHDYCSWDNVLSSTGAGLGTHFADHPPGGCGGNNAACVVCAKRFDENGGAGWPCTVNGDCPETPTSGACNTGTGKCKNNGHTADISMDCCVGGCCGTGTSGACPHPTIASGTCVGGTFSGTTTCDNSCGGLGDSCSTGATCTLGCPGGQCTTTKACASGASIGQLCTSTADCAGGAACTATKACSTSSDCSIGDTCVGGGVCPTDRASWGAYLADDVTVDVVLACAKGGERLAAMVQNRFDGIMTGGRGCSAQLGSGHCTCTADSDCGTGGSCCQTTTGCSTNTVDYHTCTTGALAQASCTDPSDCDTAGGFTCQYWAPDLMAVLEGYNDSSITPSPNCLGYAGIQVKNVCDPAFNPELLKTFCMTDTEATTTNGADSQCVGLRRTSTDAVGYPGVNAGDPALCTTDNITTPCTVALLNDGGADAACSSLCTCSTDTDCDGSLGSCGGFGVCNTLSRVCTVNGDCASGKSCITNCTGTCSKPSTRAAGFLPGIGGTNFAVCHQTAACPSSSFQKVNDICHYKCSTDADCFTGGTALSGICRKYCTSGSNIYKVCTVDGDCGGGSCSSQAVCQGRATTPSSSIACTRDQDCAAATQCAQGATFQCTTLPDETITPKLKIDGTCVSGKCTCTGIPVPCYTTTGFAPSVEYCPTQSIQIQREIYHPNNAFLGFDRMIQMIAGLGQTVAPGLLIATIPEAKGSPCNPVFGETGYYNAISSHLSSRYALTADPRTAMQRLRINEVHVGGDLVHWSILGGKTVGHAIRDKIQTLNTCRKTSGTTQFYCYDSAGTVQSTICTTSADCGAYQTCQLRLCTSGSDCPDASDTCNPQP